MKTEIRTDKQKRSYFLFQEFISHEMVSQGINLDKLIIEIKPRVTKESLHIIFKEILFKMYWKNSTNDITKEELNNCLDVYLDALATIWVHLSFPDADRKSLLESYS